MRHPSYLAGELVLATLILLLTGVDSPFFFFTLGTALLGGLVYGCPGAALFSVMLIGVYFVGLVGARRRTRGARFVLPALYPLVAAAGAALRGCSTARPRPSPSSPGAGRSGARLARDMHDSLAKTVSGIGFAALALSRRIERDPAGAVEDARRLAEDARQATREAREIIVGLRADAASSCRCRPPCTPRRGAGARRAACASALAVEDVGELHPVAARELEWILREALAQRRAPRPRDRVDVRLRRLGGRAVLTVADDGAGFEVPDDLDELARGRHFGLAGMRERARLAGGDLSVESEPGEGCVLSVWVPAEAPPRSAGPPSRRRPRRAVRYAPGPLRAGLHVAVIRVLLVDDNAIVRRGIASLLAEADGIEVVGEAGDGREAIELGARSCGPTSSAWTCGCR